MGHFSALGMSDEVNQGNITLRVAVEWHLRSNLYPPLPLTYAGPLEKAIKAARSDDWDAKISLRSLKRGDPVPRYSYYDDKGKFVISAEDLIAGCRAEGFVELPSEE